MASLLWDLNLVKITLMKQNGTGAGQGKAGRVPNKQLVLQGEDLVEVVVMQHGSITLNIFTTGW